MDTERERESSNSSATLSAPLEKSAIPPQPIDVAAPPGIGERKLMRKIDLRLLPVLCILYLLACLDRVNISNAVIFGLKEDLKLGGVEYNTALTIFFVPYIIFEIPSNILLKRLKPHIWLSLCMFLFGLTTTLQGLVNSYSGLLTTRFFLGVFESGMFPGCFYLIAMWYKRSEAQKRYSFFFGSTSLAGAVGGLLASAIGKMHRVNGWNAWRWIFIFEGIVTCVVSVFFYFIITDFPEEATFLTEDERTFVKKRLHADVGESAREEKMSWRDVVNVFKDYKIFVGGFMYFGLIVPAYGYAYFAPTIVKQFGHSTIKTQLFSVPPWACAFVFAMLIAIASDRVKHRFLFTIGPIAISVTGFSILLAVHNNHRLQYAALFLIAMGTYSAMPVVVCWFNTNLGGHHRRAVGTAWQVGFGNIGGIIATYSFLSKDAPWYTRGYSIGLAFSVLSALSCVMYFVAVTKENRRRDRGVSKYSSATEGKRVLGDENPDYRYIR